MMKRILLLFTGLCLIISGDILGQVSIISSSFNTYSASSESMMQLSIINTQHNDVEVILEAELFSAQNEVLINTRSFAVTLKPGLNTVGQYPLKVASVQYGTSNLAQHIKNARILPTGIFKYCARLKGIKNTEATDQYCEEFKSDFSSFLVLVNPFDKDTILSKSPVLTWNHSEPFDISAGENFQINVVELEKGQKAQDGIAKNQPVFKKDFINTHQVPYPFDAPNLEEGKRYGWQISRLSNNIVIDKTESWEFVIHKPKPIVNHRFAPLKKKLDASFYTVSGDKLYFTFDESYTTTGDLNCKIMDGQFNLYSPEVKPVKNDENGQVKKLGDNRFVIDLKNLSLAEGFYTLSVFNEKGEKFQMRFKIASN